MAKRKLTKVERAERRIRIEELTKLKIEKNDEILKLNECVKILFESIKQLNPGNKMLRTDYVMYGINVSLVESHCVKALDGLKKILEYRIRELSEIRNNLMDEEENHV